MKRYTITPQKKATMKIPSSAIKPSPFPRISVNNIELPSKETRNIRDKAYRASCMENICNFFSENGYDGQFSNKVLSGPSSKEFQSMFKFLFYFIDSSPFTKFEEDAIAILKLIKYPYSSEITRSQLAVVTPHTWSAVLSMMSWLVDVIKKSDNSSLNTITVESEFLNFVCEGYVKFMEGSEDDTELEAQFMNKVAIMHAKEDEEIENRKKEVELMRIELINLKGKFEDLSKLEIKKQKINEDLHMLIMNEKQLEIKKAKYMASIEKLVNDISVIETQIDNLVISKNELVNQINAQTINPEDIREMNIEKMELFKELERLKPERENITKFMKNSENQITERMDNIEKLVSEIKSKKNLLDIESEAFNLKSIDNLIISELENELAVKKENIVNYEFSQSSFNERILDKSSQFKDLEEQYNHLNSKLQTIGSIYLEKKEIFERSHQKNRNEMDRLENELLKLKLESDSLYLRSEKDYSEAKIKLDILMSNISREKEEINRMIWNFYNLAESILKNINYLEKDIKNIANQN